MHYMKHTVITFLLMTNYIQCCQDRTDWRSDYGDCSLYAVGQPYHDYCVADQAEKGCPRACGTCETYGEHHRSNDRSRARGQRQVRQDAGGFDFGSGCPAGVGDPFTVTLDKDSVKTIGIIPKGKWEVFVSLESEADLDVRLYDTEDRSKYSEGAAIVAWCLGNCNKGVLGTDPGKRNATYTSIYGDQMKVTYSGYNGYDMKTGYEYIQITGETTVDIRMEAFAFVSGTGTVAYSWGKSQSGCCTGKEPCYGSFTRALKQNDVATVGEIPAGVKNLEVNLAAQGVDLDIQLYDTTDTLRYENGHAIVGWCNAVEDPRCNYGNMAGPKLQRYVYPVVPKEECLEYRYSGYNGIGGKLGNEQISIIGTTNRKLLMAAYAFTAGTANVSYTYFEPDNELDGAVFVPSCQGQVSYYARIRGFWREDTHGNDFPTFPAFEEGMIVTHHEGYTMFKEGFYASPGFSKFIREGVNYELRTEAVRKGQAVLTTDFLGHLDGRSGSARGDITLDTYRTKISFAAKMNPSPDWFVGVDSLDFCVGGEWRDEFEIPLYPYDAGVVSGQTFTTRGQSTSVPISKIRPSFDPSSSWSDYDEIEPIAYLSFARNVNFARDEIGVPYDDISWKFDSQLQSAT